MTYFLAMGRGPHRLECNGRKWSVDHHRLPLTIIGVTVDHLAIVTYWIED
jgi:hypothetical protein